MKGIRFSILTISALILSCSDGYIDDITSVQPGPDEAPPSVSISFPLNGTQIRVLEDVTPLTIAFEATDDIELQTVTVTLDGTQIAAYSEFLDFRRLAINNLVFQELANGSHTLSVDVTDLTGKTDSQTVTFEKLEPYRPVYDGEILYMPFDGEYLDLVTLTQATVEGSPSFNTDDVVAGLGSYQGAENSYLTFPADNLTNNEFSAVFWYKLNASPDRAGILTMTPEGFDTSPGTLDNGFKFFREAGGADQRFKLNAGTGSGHSWFDGGENADLDPVTATDWQHMAFTISGSECAVYINGQVVSQGSFAGSGWDDIQSLSIMSGAPNFLHWNHASDLSQMDELRIFDKALSQVEIQSIIDAENPN